VPKVDTTVRELVDMVGRGELRLPEMQRRYVWRATRVRDLIDSLYRGYPSGAVLVWETDQDAPTRDLDVAQATSAFTTHKLLLDGQQRVTSLRAVLCDEPIRVRGRKKPIDILFNLDHPEGAPVELTEVDDDSESPLLAEEEGALDEEEDEADDLQQRLRKRTFVVASKALASIPTWIRVSDVFNPKKGDWALLKPLGLQPDDPLYEKYSQRLQKLRAIQQYQYVMHVLDRKLSYEEVAEIFVRVNSLGVKLRSSDLAMAQVTARWQNSLRLFEDFGEDLDNKSWFTLDTGLLVRTMVVFATGQSRFKTVQSISVPKMKSSWEMAKESLHFAVNFLKANCGIEDESLLTNPSLVIALAAFGAVRKQKLSKKVEQQLRQWTLIANARARYSRGSAETFLDQDLNVIFKTESLDELMASLKQQLGRLHVEADDFVGRGARSPLFSTTYLALKQRDAKDWVSGLGLSLTHQGKMHYIEYHHIFPKSLLAKRDYEKAEINEIANFAFISGRANRAITNKEPKKYLPEIIKTRGEEALTGQLIPTDPALWELDAYPAFLEWRRTRLAAELNRLLGVSPSG
jgi:hypothetical protein